jgi:two-component system chemotaxis sensor kinase CheA
MTADSLAARLLAAFLDDLDEQMRTLDANLLALESTPTDVERLTAIFRVAHTLKGAANATDVPYVGDACHTLESLLAEARDGERVLTEHDFRVLFFAKDALADAGQRLRRGQTLDDGPIAHLQPILRGEAPVPSAASVAAPVDVAGDSQIRVAPDKADALMASGSQLLVSRSRLAGRTVEAAALSDFVSHWAADWRVRGPTIRRVLAASDASKLIPLLDAFSRNLDRVVHDAGQLTTDVSRDADAFRDMIGDLFDRVRSIRMRPVADATAALPRAIRDACATVGKSATLMMTGTEVEADRGVLDALRDALIHLVRNAVDHGIESPDARERAGKPRDGRITLSAALRGERLVVTVSDDGAGIDPAVIRAALRARGLPIPAEDADVLRTLFLNGFSTRAEATTISGRGVGLNAVDAAIGAIGGTVTVASTLGQGTTFTLECPVTLATIRALLVSVGGQTLAIPTASIVHLQRARPDELVRAEGRDVYLTEGTPVPVVSLARLLGPPLAGKPVTGSIPLVVIQSPDGRLAVAVDQLREEEEIVVRPIERAGGALPALSGAAILGTGDIALVINPSIAIPQGLGLGAGHSLTPDAGRDQSAAARKRILVVDDSITTRTLEQSTLEAAGYDVVTAVDGADAWRRIQEESFALIVSDIEMPRMDGLTLCETIRANKRTQQLPVILVTALESTAQRKRGLDVGANAYVGKSTFDQQTLVETVRQLVG